MINQYMEGADSPLMQTYVPIPFQEMVQAGAMVQDRYDDTLSTNEESLGLLQNINSLQSVNLGKGYDPIQFKDREIVTKRAEEYKTRIEELGQDFDYLSSPEGKAKAKSIINSIRQDLGPQGVFGMANQRYAANQEFQSQLAKDTSLTYSPERMVNAYNTYSQYAGQPQMSQMNLEAATPGEYVNVRKELNDVASSLKDSFIKELPAGTPVEDVHRLLQQKGVTGDRIADAIISDFENNPRLQKAVEQHVIYNRQSGKGPQTTKDFIAGQIDASVDANARINVSDKSYIDADARAAKAAARKKKEEQFDWYAESNTFVPSDKSNAPSSMADYTTAVTMGEAGLQEAENNLSRYVEANGITTVKAPDGTDIYLDSNGVDKTRLVKPYLNEIKSQEDKNNNLERYYQRVKLEAGFRPGEDIFAKLKASGEYETLSQEFARSFKEDVSPITGVHKDMNKKFPGIKQALLDGDQNAYVLAKLGEVADSEKFLKLNEILENNAKDNNFIATQRQLDPKVSKEMETFFISTVGDFNKGNYSLMSNSTDNAGHIYTLDEMKDMQLSFNNNKNKPVISSYYLDKSGAFRMQATIYSNDPNKDGEIVDRVSFAAPSNFAEYLESEGMLEQGEMVRKAQISQELDNALDVTGYNADHTISLIPSVSNENVPKAGFRVNRNPDGSLQYVVTINKVATPYSSQDEAINRIYTLRKNYETYLSKKAQEQANKNK